MIPIDIGGQHWALVHVGIGFDLVVYSDSWLATRAGYFKGEGKVRAEQSLVYELLSVVLPDGDALDDMYQ
jgi:hypothetical protein